uniref:Uncharacterized protein n=1 Tax=Arundo donax TaxID=35708 RepID=A0A0A9BW04_ARUDO
MISMVDVWRSSEVQKGAFVWEVDLAFFPRRMLMEEAKLMESGGGRRLWQYRRRRWSVGKRRRYMENRGVIQWSNHG